MLMSAAVAPSSSVTPHSSGVQSDTASQHAVHFAVVTAQLLEHLTLGASGSALAPLLTQAVASLRHHDLLLEHSGDSVLANKQSVAPMADAAWLSQLKQNGVQQIHFHREASGAELLHFLALLAGPAGDIPFAKLWLERGAWHIHVDISEVTVPAPDESCYDVTALLTEIVSASGALQRDVTDEELDTLSDAVARGALVNEGSPLLTVLRLAGERAVRSLLVTLANATSGSQRRILFETVALLNVGHQYLVTLLAHPTWFVVRNAASLLGELQVKGADAALTALLKHEDPRVRVAAVNSLGRFPSDKASESLLAAATDRSADVRATAWSAWKHREQPPCADAVSRALREEADRTVQRALLDCVARFETLDVANALVRFCASATANAAPIELLAYGIDLLAQRRPQSAVQFVRRLADTKA